MSATISQAAAYIRRWRDNPVIGVRELFRAEPDTWQVKVLEAFKVEPRIAMKACKGPGKSCLMAWMAWLFLLTRPQATGFAVSITGDNLRDNLWTELAHWRAQSPLLQKAFLFGAETIRATDHPDTWWFSARAFAKDADPQAQAATLAGKHGKHVLILLDEVSDYPDGVVVAAEGAQSVEGQEVKLIVAGNPTRSEGPLWRICTTDRAHWWVIEITGDPDASDRAPRISIDWARKQIATWGRDSSYVMTNVLGKFPKVQSDKLLGPDDISQALERVVLESECTQYAKVLGIDVARFGDDRSTFIPRHGRAMLVPTVYRELDEMQLAGRAARYIESFKPHATFIDITGGTGAGTYDRLKELGFRVFGVQFGGAATESERFENKRAEMWWRAAQWIKAGGSLPTRDSRGEDIRGVLTQELTAPSYKFASNGRLVLDPKKDIKKRLGISPDIGDGLALTFAEHVQAPVRIEDPLFGFSAQSNRAVTDYNPFHLEA